MQVVGETLARHGRLARGLHLVNALAVLVLFITGLALAGLLPAGVTASLGGHLGVNNAHRLLGLALSCAAVLLLVLCPRRMMRLLADIVYYARQEWRWFPRFVLLLVKRDGRKPPFHDGRFDPAQRVVFLLVMASLAALCATGTYLCFSPPLNTALMGPLIRIHIGAVWVLAGCLCLHILAGSGLLRTHRHITAAMFGNGRVPLARARVLWPGWAQRQTARNGRAQARSHKHSRRMQRG